MCSNSAQIFNSLINAISFHSLFIWVRILIRPIHKWVADISLSLLINKFLTESVSYFFPLAVYMLRNPGCLSHRLYHSVILLIASLWCDLTSSSVLCSSFELVAESKDLLRYAFSFLDKTVSWFVLCPSIRVHIIFAFVCNISSPWWPKPRIPLVY